MEVLFFKSKICPNCPLAQKMLDDVGIEYKTKLIDDEDDFIEALMYNIKSTPSIIADGNIYVGVDGVREFLEDVKNGG